MCDIVNLKVNVTIFLTLISLFYSILLIIGFFSRKRIELKENKMYSSLIITNFIGIILEIFCCIFAGFAKDHMLFYTIINKLFLVYLITWNTIFTMYVFYVSFNDKENIKMSKRIRNFFYIIYFFFIFLVTVLNVNFNFKDGFVMYSYGPSVDVVYLFIILAIIFMIICVIKKFKNIRNKKYYPLYVFLFLGGITGFIQISYPELLLATAMETFITVIMYFTIENPDVKLLEEVHTAKKLVDSANEEKTMFLYNMMGEVRSIASSINLSSNMILDSNNIEEVKEYTRDIISYNNKFYNMSNDIYNIDEIELSNIKVINNKYDTKLFFKKIVSNYMKLLEETDTEFRFNIDNNLPSSLYGDSINLKEVLVTILDNACKYTEKGFVEFNVNTIIKHDICRLIINVEDSGIGIKADEIEKSINKNKEIDYNGSLYNARKLITVMGGSLIITSDYNKGTKVTIVLDQKINNKKKNINDNYGSYIHDIKVLLVDDNVSSQKLISKILTKNKINIEVVSLAKECLDKIRDKEKYDIILVDEDMPYIDGKELMKKLKLIRNFKIPVILLTKNKGVEYSDEYKKNGFTNYVIKPINKDNLIEVIISIVDKDKKN